MTTEQRVLRHLPLNLDAQGILVEADIQAGLYQRDYIGTEHLLLAFVNGSAAMRVGFQEIGITHEKIHAALDMIPTDEARLSSGERRRTQRVQRIIEEAEQRARREGALGVSDVHLFLAFSNADGFGQGILEALGVKEHQLHKIAGQAKS